MVVDDGQPSYRKRDPKARAKDRKEEIPKLDTDPPTTLNRSEPLEPREWKSYSDSQERTWKLLADMSISMAKDDDPSRPFVWQSRTFFFTRYVRGQSGFKNLTGAQAFKKIPWELTPFDQDDKIAFIQEWKKVKIPVGQSLLAQAVERANADPLFQYEQFPRFARFLSICAWLQRIVGDCNIIFGTRDMAQVLGARSRQSTSDYAALAVDEGYLKIVKTYPRQSRKANEYVFDLTRVPNLKEGDS